VYKEKAWTDEDKFYMDGTRPGWMVTSSAWMGKGLGV
jgi:hypothetical protein